MDEPNSLSYHRGSLSGPQLQQVVNDILEDLRNAEDLDAVAASVGLTSDDVRALSVRVSESESSIDPTIGFILVHLAGGAVSVAGGAAATSFWRKVVVPLVRRRKGGDAIGEEGSDAE